MRQHRERDMTTRDELMVGLADELARDAATYAAGTPTRKLLHRAADALRPASRQEVSVTVEELADWLDKCEALRIAYVPTSDDDEVAEIARALLAEYSITKLSGT